MKFYLIIKILFFSTFCSAESPNYLLENFEDLKDYLIERKQLCEKNIVQYIEDENREEEDKFYITFQYGKFESYSDILSRISITN